jgi:CHASE3 domain sensor protein
MSDRRLGTTSRKPSPAQDSIPLRFAVLLCIVAVIAVLWLLEEVDIFGF